MAVAGACATAFAATVPSTRKPSGLVSPSCRCIDEEEEEEEEDEDEDEEEGAEEGTEEREAAV